MIVAHGHFKLKINHFSEKMHSLSKWVSGWAFIFKMWFVFEMCFRFQNVKGFERFFFSFFRKKLFGKFHAPGVMKIRENWLKMIVAHGHFKFPLAHGHFKFLVAHGHLQIPCGTWSFTNSLWHAVISNFLWHMVISNFLWHTVIYKFPVAHCHFKFPVAHGHFKFLVARGHLQIPCGTRSFQIL